MKYINAPGSPIHLEKVMVLESNGLFDTYVVQTVKMSLFVLLLSAMSTAMSMQISLDCGHQETLEIRCQSSQVQDFLWISFDVYFFGYITCKHKWHSVQ